MEPPAGGAPLPGGPAVLVLLLGPHTRLWAGDRKMFSTDGM